MVVEFLGLPGAGKSTLASHVADRLAARGIRVERSPHVLSHASGKVERITWKGAALAAEIVGHPFHAYRAARTVAATQQRTAADLARTFANWLYVEALLRRGASGAGVRLVEQGVAQALWSVGLSADDVAWANLVERDDVPRLTPDLVVLVETDLDTVRRRLADRSATVRLERMLKQDETMLARASSVLATVVRLLWKRGTPIIVTSNGHHADLTAGAATVASRIAASWHDRAAASSLAGSELLPRRSFHDL